VPGPELFEAIRTGDKTLVESILSEDHQLASAKNENGVCAVLMSIYLGRAEIRDVLLRHGAMLQVPEAAAVGSIPRLKELLEQNPSSVNNYSSDGFPAIALACVFGQLEAAQLLASHGADLRAAATNGSGYNALTGAVASGHTEVVKWLLENGADANYRYGAGYSPLLTAAANGHLAIVKLLLSHGADRNATTNDGKSAAQLAADRNHPELAEFLTSRR
jgi:ankyrin repeat protein